MRVGSKYAPPISSTRDLPPARTLAPLETALSTSSATRLTASSWISGPTSVPSANGSPSFSLDTRTFKSSVSLSITPSCTKTRLGDTQVCPAARNLPCTSPSAAFSRSASSMMMKGALPPSSSATRLMVLAACSISSAPISVEPVKATIATSSEPVRTGPISRASPVTTLNTPLGKPARSASSASASADSGVSDAGLMTMGQPTARAGPHLRVIMADGKFHGVMHETTPTGWRMVQPRAPGVGTGSVSPWTRRASSAAHWTKPAP